MKIEKMELRNFKCHKELDIEFSDKVVISGDNGTGKSTVFDGYLFLFFGKSSNGSADANAFKPIVKGVLQEGVDVSVLGVIDGVSYKRILSEKWVRKRGSSTDVFQGNEMKYEIDSLPVLKRDFDKAVGELTGGLDEFLLMSDVKAFANLHWKERRAVLIGKNEELDALTDELKKLAVTQKGLSEAVKLLPVRIDEQFSSIVESKYTEGEYEESQAKLEKLKEERILSEQSEDEVFYDKAVSALKTTWQDSKNGATEEKQEQLETENKRHNSSIGIIRDEQKAEVESEALLESKIKALNMSSFVERSRLEAKKTSSELLVKAYQEQLATMRTDWGDENGTEFIEEGVCSSCGQDIPSEMQETSRNNFLLNKSTALERLVSLANDVKRKVATESVVVDEATKGILDIPKDSVYIPRESEYDSEIKAEILEYQKNCDLIEARYSAFVKDATIDYDKRIELLKKPKLEATDDSEELLSSLEAETQELLKQKAVLFGNNKATERVESLKVKLKEKSALLAKQEQRQYEIESEIVTLVEKEEASVNERFRFTKFKLFDTQINGGIVEVCTPMVDGVEYKNLNTAMQVNVGLDIINTVSIEKGKSFPIWCDKAESVNVVEQTDSQLVLLKVSEIGEKLEVKNG